MPNRNQSVDRRQDALSDVGIDVVLPGITLHGHGRDQHDVAARRVQVEVVKTRHVRFKKVVVEISNHVAGVDPCDNRVALPLRGN
jgi:hypothetical protein